MFNEQFYMFSDLLARGLTGILIKTPGFAPGPGPKENLKRIPFNYTRRYNGKDWPEFASTMAGMKRQMNIRDLIVDVEKHDIPGDIVEAGVWRGGSSIMIRGILDYINSPRTNWLFDSFSGLPKPTTNHDDARWARMDYVAVSLQEVKEYFHMANVRMDKVKFVKGFHCDTFPGVRNGTIPLGNISILRMDSDMWEASMDILFHVWDRISVGGWVINDDGYLPADQAIKDFSNIHEFSFDKIQVGDGVAYYFQKTKQMDITIKYSKYYKTKINH